MKKIMPALFVGCISLAVSAPPQFFLSNGWLRAAILIPAGLPWIFFEKRRMQPLGITFLK